MPNRNFFWTGLMIALPVSAVMWLVFIWGAFQVWR